MSLALDPTVLKPAPFANESRDPLTRLFAGLALVLGGLRFLALDGPSLWLDEALTLADASRGGGVNPFGYWVFDHFYALCPGRPDEFWLRFPAAVFGLASILAISWALGPFVGRRASALAAFFLAASAWHLYWSQNARFYTLAQCLALLGAGALLRGLYGGSSLRAFLGAVLGLLLLGLSALTHPSAVFLIAPLLCVPWAARWMDWIPRADGLVWRLFSLAGLAALVVGSGWALRAWLKWEARQGSGSLLHFAKTAGYLLTPTLGCAFLVGAWRGWRTRESFVVVWVAGLGLAAATLASFFVRVSAQYVFVLQPWVAACAGVALAPRLRVGDPVGRNGRVALLALLVALPALLETGLYFSMRNGDRPRWREAYAYVFEHRGPRDLVLGMEAPVAEYYLSPRATALRAWTEVTWLDDYRSRLPLDWARYDRRIWFVVNATQLEDWGAQQSSLENRAELERILREECTHVRSFEIPFTPRDLDVHVYVTRARDP